jgi:hypothetical protein
VGALTEVISGGQTGADRGALDAAIAVGLSHGGWCPKGRRAEDGRIPDRYVLNEMPTADYPARTRKNIQEADATLVFTLWKSTPGTALTQRLVEELDACAMFWLVPDDADLQALAAKQIADWIRANEVRTLNVAGPRESHRPGLQQAVRDTLIEAFTLLGVEAAV